MEELPDVQHLVKSVANKQQANKRKRDPDMYLNAVLECTVRRLNRERMDREEVARKRKRRTREVDVETSTTATSTGSCGNGSLMSPDLLLNNLKTMDSSRTFIADTVTALDESECGEMDKHLDDELPGDLKEFLDELAREFPGDFWLTDANNNNCSLASESDQDGSDNELWLTNIIEVLCSS